MMAAPQLGPAPILPFEVGTDYRYIELGTQTFTPGGSTISQLLDKTGLLNEIFLTLTGTLTLSAATTFAPFGPWNILKNVSLFMNLNNNTLVDCSGYDLYLANCLETLGWAPDITADPALYQINPTNTAAQTVVLKWRIPVGLNDEAERRYGVLNLADPRVQVYVRVTPGAATDMVTSLGTGSFTPVTLAISQGIWELPPIVDPNTGLRYEQLGSATWPQSFHRLLSQNQAIAATGPQVITVPRDNASIMRLLYYGMQNSVRGNAYSTIEYRYDILNKPVVMNPDTWHFRQRKRTGLDWVDGASNTAAPRRGGVYVLDRWTASHYEGTGKFWDFVHLPRLNQLDFVPTIPSGTTLASGDLATLVREELEIPQMVGA